MMQETYLHCGQVLKALSSAFLRQDCCLFGFCTAVFFKHSYLPHNSQETC